jgi:hypothetical protein
VDVAAYRISQTAKNASITGGCPPAATHSAAQQRGIEAARSQKCARARRAAAGRQQAAAAAPRPNERRSQRQSRSKRSSGDGRPSTAESPLLFAPPRLPRTCLHWRLHTHRRPAEGTGLASLVFTHMSTTAARNTDGRGGEEGLLTTRGMQTNTQQDPARHGFPPQKSSRRL